VRVFESFGEFDPRWLDVPPGTFFIFHPWTCATITTVLYYSISTERRYGIVCTYSTGHVYLQSYEVNIMNTRHHFFFPCSLV